jgi:hypothetical protein
MRGQCGLDGVRFLYRVCASLSTKKQHPHFPMHIGYESDRVWVKVLDCISAVNSALNIAWMQ